VAGLATGVAVQRAAISILFACEAILRSWLEGSAGASAARWTICALRIVASGSPETFDVSMLTSPPTA
jgi:hypothetical protein